MERRTTTLVEPRLLLRALGQSLRKLNPVSLWRNPVMLAVELGALVTTAYIGIDAARGEGVGFVLQVSVWLWFTVIFANFAEALAEAQGTARAESLRKSRHDLVANVLREDGSTEPVPATKLRKDDVILLKDGEVISGDGEVIEGTSLVDESAITGESAPVIREAGGDRSGVTGGSRVLSGTIKVKITANPGETFLDNMIKMVESARRNKTPNEIALEILLIGLTVLFIVVVVTLPAFAGYMGVSTTVPILISLLVCLMPTTIGGLLPAIGIAGTDRLLQHNIIALSGRAIEAAGDVDVVLLDKTGTITLGNRMATELIPATGASREETIEAALLSSLSDETPEGRSIVVLCKNELGIKGRDIRAPEGAMFIPFSAQTRMSGVDTSDRRIRKGSVDAVRAWVETAGGAFSEDLTRRVDAIAGQGDTPLVIADGPRPIGVVRLKDVLKQGIKARLSQLRQLGIKSVMITGDNPLTAASIAAEAGLDDFVAQARPEAKLEMIRKYQTDGHLVAMIGDGTNDAPALAQADVAVAMNAGTQAAREAANMIDLDSNPTQLLDIVEVGKQILITRGALTTFSIANDVSKYFAIVPAIFAAVYPQLGVLNVMHLANPSSAVLAAVVFNAIIIPLLIPIALRGVRFRTQSASALLRLNLLVYGVGGLLLPFIGIKLLDLLLVWLHLA
ncbi:MAG: potassium-transporting ATPase subunit KdpB [candidate division WOR-3 bacterium]|nr:potassium-transporting ATPase subunit KdpB [candidate division WOR-3 bacterium]